MNYLKLLPKNIPTKLTSNNVVYSLLILIIIISFLKKEHMLLSLFVIIQCSIFLIFSNKNKNVWMLIVNVLGLLCLFFLLMKNKEGIRKLGRSIQRSMLETITRKYCIEYDCRELYIDRKYEFTNKKELLKKIEEEERKKSENQSSIFVKFKDYNKKGVNNNIVVLDDTLKFKRKGKIKNIGSVGIT